LQYQTFDTQTSRVFREDTLRFSLPIRKTRKQREILTNFVFVREKYQQTLCVSIISLQVILETTTATFNDDTAVLGTDSDPATDCFREPANKPSRNPNLV
jgi:hypothetical protein